MAHRFALLTIRNGVASCLMLAATALLAVQAIGPGHALILAAGILYGRRTRRPLLPARAWDALAVAALLVFPLDLMAGSGNLIGAALRLLSFVVLYRCANLSEHHDLRQAVALSFVQMLAAAASTTEVWFSLFLAAYLLMAVWTLMAMASARDGAPASARKAPPGLPAAAMTGLTVMAGAMFFVAIPHFGTGYFQPSATARGHGDTLSGFSDRIELGAINRIKKNRAVVMRVRIHGGGDPATLPLRWRGVALDTFDGRSWSVSSTDRRWVERDPDGSFHLGAPLRRGESPLDHEISMMPLMVPVLFTSPGPVRVVFEGAQALGVDGGGAVHLAQPPLSRFTYRVVAPSPGRALNGYGEDDPLGHSPVHLALPRLDPRIVKLAEAAAAGADSPLDKARRVEEHLRSRYGYSLEVEDRGVSDPLARFLIEHQPGHCEYFATAMTVMLRCLEIPSRVVNGFQSGEWSGLTGAWVVRQSDAHTWVEAWIEGRGWVTFDPTPSPLDTVVEAGLLARWRAGLSRMEVLWDTWVVGLDLLDQQSLAASLFDGAALAALGGAALAARLAESFTSLAASGWPAGAAVVVLVAIALAVMWLVTRLRAWLPGFTRPRGSTRLSARARRAAEAFVAFEARWSARGVIRRPGQTAMDLAGHLERSALLPPGEATRFVAAYYRDRFGP